MTRNLSCVTLASKPYSETDASSSSPVDIKHLENSQPHDSWEMISSFLLLSLLGEVTQVKGSTPLHI